MKKILLIGDSICAGYNKEVKEALSKVAEVSFPNDSGRFAQYVLRNIDVWQRELKLDNGVDLVHWNAGLWDSLEIYGDEPLTPLNVYEGFLDRIYKRIKLLFPNAKIIFATSTPVQEDKYDKRVYNRRNSVIEEYNKVAIAVAEKHGAGINDLYTLLKDVPKSYFSDMTHYYTEEGTKIITSQVLKSIAEALDIPKADINYELTYDRDVAVFGI